MEPSKPPTPPGTSHQQPQQPSNHRLPARSDPRYLAKLETLLPRHPLIGRSKSSSWRAMSHKTTCNTICWAMCMWPCLRMAWIWAWTLSNFLQHNLSGLPNAKSQRFSYVSSQIATLPPVVALNRSSKSQIAARYAAFWHAVPQIALASFL